MMKKKDNILIIGELPFFLSEIRQRSHGCSTTQVCLVLFGLRTFNEPACLPLLPLITLSQIALVVRGTFVEKLPQECWLTPCLLPGDTPGTKREADDSLLSDLLL